MSAPIPFVPGRALARAYEAAAERHNALGLTPPIEPRVSGFHDRPYQVIHGSRFWQALRYEIQDEALRRLAADQHAIIGSTSQWADSTDVLAGRWVAPLRAFYGGALDDATSSPRRRSCSVRWTSTSSSVRSLTPSPRMQPRRPET